MGDLAERFAALRDGEGSGPGPIIPVVFSEAGAEEGFPGELFRDSELGGMNGPIKTKIKADTAKPEKPEVKRKAEKATVSVPRGTASERQIAEIGDALTEKAGQLAGIMSGALPVTAVYMGERSERAVQALLSIAKKNPKMLAGLQKAAIGIDVMELGTFLIGFAVAMQVDMNRLKGDELICQSFGVTQILEEHFTEEPVENPAVFTQAPRFDSI